MDFKEYQTKSSETASYPLTQKLLYPSLGLCGEAGEVANKVKKVFRDQGGLVTDTTKQAIADELGDVLWYVNQVAVDLGVDLNEIAENNIKKLHSRKERGTINGSGDNR